MGKVKFIFDLKKDLENINYVFKKDKKYGLPKELKFFGEEDARKKIIALHNSNFLKKYIKTLEINWKFFEKRFFMKLSEITGKPITHKKYVAYLTTMKRCPYFYHKDFPWFMVSYFSPISLIFLTIAHELIHMQFCHYYREKVIKQVGKNKTHHINEALTVLINEEFQELFNVNQIDPTRTAFRNFIINEWRKEKNFDLLISKCIKYVKNKKIYAKKSEV